MLREFCKVIVDAETKSQLLNQKIGEDADASESGQLTLWEAISQVKDSVEDLVDQGRSVEERIALQEGSTKSVTWQVESMSDKIKEVKFVEPSKTTKVQRHPISLHEWNEQEQATVGTRYSKDSRDPFERYLSHKVHSVIQKNTTRLPRTNAVSSSRSN